MKKILAVEDDKFLGAAYRVKFTNAGFDFRLATDGEEAMLVLREYKPDLIIMDLVMPRKDGFSTIAELHKHDEYKDIPIIVASNLGQKEELEKAHALGVTDYFVKSDLPIEELLNKVIAILT